MTVEEVLETPLDFLPHEELAPAPHKVSPYRYALTPLLMAIFSFFA
jgi:hypothetical protein